MEPSPPNGRVDEGYRDAFPFISKPDASNVESPSQILRSISMIDVLEQDPRPAFVLDLEANTSGTSLQPVFQNRALRNAPGLIDVVTGDSPPDTYGQTALATYSAFKRWATDPTTSCQPTGFTYHGMTWTSMTINVRWRMVNGIKEGHQERLTGTFSSAEWGPKATPVVDPL